MARVVEDSDGTFEAQAAPGLAALSVALVVVLGCASTPPAAGVDAATAQDASAIEEDAGTAGIDASEFLPDAASGEPDAAAGDAAAEEPDAGFAPIALRYLAINVGNASFQFGCWEYKICRAQEVESLRDYIATWKPDVVLLSEVSRGDQLTGTAVNGPILPDGWDGTCGKSVDRATGAAAAFDAPHASHEHECVAWKTSRVSLVPGSVRSAYGRNDDYGKAQPCDYDFTGIRAKLRLDGVADLTAVAVHPDSQKTDCRTEEIGRYWSLLADGERVIIGGDWNTESRDEIARPRGFAVNYSRGLHWDLALHSDEYSAWYGFGAIKRRLDHSFSSFGVPCIDCGGYYHTFDLPFGSALGGYDKHPRADNGTGFDHRQVLVDVTITR